MGDGDMGEKTFLISRDELVTLMLNTEQNMKRLTKNCNCETGSICFKCESLKLLGKLSRKTGIPILPPQMKKRSTKKSRYDDFAVSIRHEFPEASEAEDQIEFGATV